ncbi:hypothetical protein M0805_002849 [Coniferiporia weirii]|nr:hypothetical protein M0805_002849 [Coniferiporia weirii]
MLKHPDSAKWIQVASEEIQVLIQNGTWTVEQLPEGRKVVGCHWVFKLKCKADGSIDQYKARLVAKGFSQQLGMDFDQTFSPTAKWAALRTILALAALEDLCLFSVDISNAFLNGNMEHEVYMDLLEGYKQLGLEDASSGYALKLVKALYGLKQAGRQWHCRPPRPDPSNFALFKSSFASSAALKPPAPPPLQRLASSPPSSPRQFPVLAEEPPLGPAFQMSSPDPLQGAPSSPVLQADRGEDMAMEVGSPHTPQAQTGKRSADTLTPLVCPAQVTESQRILYESVARFEDLHRRVTTGPPDATPAQTAYELARFIGRMLAHCHVTLTSLKQAQEGGTHPQNVELHNVVTQYGIAATGYEVDLPAPFSTGAHGPPPGIACPTPPSDEMKELKSAMLKLTSDVGAISRQASRTPAPTNVGGTQTVTVTPAPTAGAPISYTQATAQPAAPTNPTQAPATATNEKKKKPKRQLPPPPKMFAKDPTLVLSTGLHIPRADSRLSGSILTQRAREFFNALPTADQVTILSSAFNTKGNIITVFAQRPTNSTPTTEMIIDCHQVAFTRHMRDRCLVADAVLPDDFILSPSHVHQRSALHISMVPTTDMFGPRGKIFTPSQLLSEVKHNPVLCNLDFVIPPTSQHWPRM